MLTTFILRNKSLFPIRSVENKHVMGMIGLNSNPSNLKDYHITPKTLKIALPNLGIELTDAQQDLLCKRIFQVLAITVYSLVVEELFFNFELPNVLESEDSKIGHNELFEQVCSGCMCASKCVYGVSSVFSFVFA